MRRSLVMVLVAGLLLAPLSPAHARARWKKRIDRIARGHSISISVADRGDHLYRWDARARRTPASVEKLLVSMALLDTFGESDRIATTAATNSVTAGVVPGDLWLLGRGDPTITGGGSYGHSLTIRPTRLARLARRIERAGVKRIQGRVMASTRYFRRDWWAPGWKSDFPRKYIPLPTALTFEGNRHRGNHVDDPERRAARNFKRRLEAAGVKVIGTAGSGAPPSGLDPVARIRSEPLRVLLRYMNRHSSNFFAEVLGKRLGRAVRGTGSIAAGATAIETWAERHGVGVSSHDSSGLSYSNRMSPKGVARLLGLAEGETWGPALRESLPTGGQGTLEDRLRGVPVRAKTGTLTYVSALSGWVWLERTDSWAEFSIMSSGMYKSTAADIEDRIVTILHNRGR